MATCEVVLLYTAAAILGFCCLFAYNSFLSSPSYLEHYFQFAAVKFTDNVSTLPHAKSPSFWANISTWVTVLMMVPMFLLQFLMLSPWVLRQNLQIRMIVGAVFSLIAVLLVPVCAASGGVSEGGAMAVLIIACLLCGAATTTLESALYAFFGSMPTKYMAGFVMGGGFSGTINSVLRIVITVGLPSTFSGVKTSAVIFFAIGMALMVVTIAIVLLMRLSPLVRSYCEHYRRPGDVARSAHAEAAEKMRRKDQLLDADNSDAAADAALTTEEQNGVSLAAKKPPVGSAALVESAVEVQDDEPLNRDNVSTSRTQSGSDPEAAVSSLPEKEEEEEGQASVFTVVRKIWIMMVCLTANMFTSLVLFPGIGLHAMETKKVSSSASKAGDGTTWGAEAIMPMIVVLMYKAGDTLGRLTINFRRVWVPRSVIPYIVVIRAIACVIPLALGVCTPKIINSNANPIVVFLVLGLTNGYLVGMTMAYGHSDPRLTRKEREIAGACLCFALLTGNTFGSVVSLIVVTKAL